MTPTLLLNYIHALPEYLPQTKALEAATCVGVGFDGAWYRSQKEHWIGWVSEYNGAGAYGRADAAKRDAKSIYNRIQCAPMLFWLAEALEMPTPQLETAFKMITNEGSKGAKQCGALRSVIKWQDLETAMVKHHYSITDRFWIGLARRRS